MVEFFAKVLLTENIFYTRILSMCIHSTVVGLTKRLSLYIHAPNQLHTCWAQTLRRLVALKIR